MSLPVPANLNSTKNDCCAENKSCVNVTVLALFLFCVLPTLQHFMGNICRQALNITEREKKTGTYWNNKIIIFILKKTQQVW